MTELRLRALIADDEPLGREIIRAMLAQQHNIDIVGECENGTQAIASIQALRPDLLFLDVQMPGLDGFQVIQRIDRELLPYIVFVTAYDQYAVKAFDVNALDYLLKPIDPDRFAQAVQRARAAVCGHPDFAMSRRILDLIKAQQQQQFLERLAIKKDGKIIFLRVSDTEWIIAEGNYVTLFAGKKRYQLRSPMSALEAKLDPTRFQRINRSTIVNIDFIMELVPMFRGEHQVVMRDGTRLKLSARFRKNLAGCLGDTF